MFPCDVYGQQWECLVNVPRQFQSTHKTIQIRHREMAVSMPPAEKVQGPGSVGLEAQEIYNPFLTPFPDIQRFCLRDQ